MSVRKSYADRRKRRSGSLDSGAATGAYEDLAAAGVIDPAKVARTALQNATSIAGLMLATDAMIADTSWSPPFSPNRTLAPRSLYRKSAER